MSDTLTSTSQDLALQCFAQLANNLERDRDAWRREAALQHEIAVGAFADLRQCAGTIERLTDAVERLQTKVRHQREIIEALNNDLRRGRAA